MPYRQEAEPQYRRLELRQLALMGVTWLVFLAGARLWYL